MARGRKTEGRARKRGKRWHLDYTVNGVRRRESLGEDITTERQAMAELEKRVAPFRTADKAAKAKAMVHAMNDAVDAENRAGDISLSDSWNEFAELKKGRSAKTQRMYEQRWKAFLAWLNDNHPHIRNLGQLNRSITVAYGAHLSARNIAASTFNAHRQALIMITGKLIVKAGLTMQNPWKAVDTQSLDTVSRKEFSREQVASLLDQLSRPGFEIQSRAMVERDGHQVRSTTMYPLANQDEWYVVFSIGTFAGLRLADCVLLTWESIDFRKQELTTIPLKTKRKLKRVHVPLHPSLFDVLKDARGRVDSSEEHVCPALAKRYGYNPTGVDKDAVSIIDAAFPDMETTKQIEGRDKAAVLYGFHSLRHTFVSVCSEAGVPLATVQAIVGHGSPAMTRHYTHISPEATRKAVEAFNLDPQKAITNSTTPSVDDAGKLAKVKALLHSKARLSKLDKQILTIIDS